MRIVKGFGFFLAFFCVLDVSGQIIIANPAFPVQTDSVIITYDATQGNQGLMGFTGDVYAHTGVITQESSHSGDWKHAPAWGDNSAKYKLERIATDLYQLKIVPGINDYYGILPTEVVKELAFVFRSADNTKEGKTASGDDIFHPVYVAGLNVSIVKPAQRPLIVEVGDTIFVEARAQQSDSLILIHNSEVIKKTTEQFVTDTLIVQEEGKTWIKVIAKDDTSEVTDSLFYFSKKEVPVQALPEGLEDGINYLNDTTVSLVLYAPGKEFVHVVGGFSDWELSDRLYMSITPDGKRFWITIDSLEAGKEYIFQYLVDGSIRIGDPYAEKVSDPQDKYISENTYPGLIPYPEGKTTGIASCLQTARTGYEWKNTDFVPSPVDELVVYELLIRDFIEKHDYQTLIDTIHYFKELGVNAVELMPVNEFEGNSSWGYNTTHYFAPDKYYGPKKDLQRFIDTCHSHGIAVLLDIVLNHSFGQSPMVRLYWDTQNNRPAANNPWFNQIPKHEFNVGYDMNHESEATKYFVNRVLKFWLEEYHVDGYRFDLSKGLTQKNTLGSASEMAKYDGSRIAILKAYADTIWKVNPDAYVILEHFADNDEEQVLTNYGMMVWGNSQYNYSRAGMGWNNEGKSDFSWGSYKTRGFSKPHLVTYMESHDEQRHMYDVVKWGNYNNPNYNVRNNLEIALVRAELCASFFFTIPGPKMMWQFGEQGYDYDLHYNNDKLGPKPIRWDYLEDPNRQRLYQVYSTLAHLKQSHAVFNTTDFSIDVADTMKTIHLHHEEMDVTIIGNFDTYPGTIDPSFSKTGTWYDYLSGDSLVVSDVHMPVDLDKSEYRIYTSVKLPTPDLISAPRALDVSISGNSGIGEELTGHYTYYDQNSDPEGDSKYKWFKGKYANGAERMQILGAVGRTYTIKETDWNHYIFFEVTPVAESGDLLTGIAENGTLDLATSNIQPAETGKNVLIYPNPSRESFHVRIEKAAGNQYSLELYNINGSLVYRMEQVAEKGAVTEFYIDVSGIDRGVYLLKLRTDGEQIIRKIIKL
ncbi:MAG: T9SS type A sorting domain-containing protein [Bacteroidales bacterium]|nr:T9SS type A sorting domain-containing protein [Bacteroidales bacterium]